VRGEPRGSDRRDRPGYRGAVRLGGASASLGGTRRPFAAAAGSGRPLLRQLVRRPSADGQSGRGRRELCSDGHLRVRPRLRRTRVRGRTERHESGGTDLRDRIRRADHDPAARRPRTIAGLRRRNATVRHGRRRLPVAGPVIAAVLAGPLSDSDDAVDHLVDWPGWEWTSYTLLTVRSEE